jgi:hypothetical protein
MQIFKDRTVYIRVVEVTGNPREPVLLENDDVLRPRDVVCLLDELPPGARPSTSSDPHTGAGSGPDKYGKRLENIFVDGGGGYVRGSGSSRPLEEYTFKKGKISFVVRIASVRMGQHASFCLLSTSPQTWPSPAFLPSR